jgi:hypothetical protein
VQLLRVLLVAGAQPPCIVPGGTFTLAAWLHHRQSLPPPGVVPGHTRCAGKAKRKRSGKQRRRDKATQAGLEQRQAKRQAQQELERQTGSQGLFAVLNSIIGDSSGAQAVRSRMAGGTAGGQADSKPRHSLFGGSAATGGAGPGSASGGGKAAIQHKEEDRRQLSQRADELAQLGVKVQRLRWELRPGGCAEMSTSPLVVHASHLPSPALLPLALNAPSGTTWQPLHPPTPPHTHLPPSPSLPPAGTWPPATPRTG